MPELPDLELYLAALRPRVLGRRLERVRLASPFLLRSTDPRIAAFEGHAITELGRLGKRLVFGFAAEEELFLVLHLMIAGRLRWRPAGASLGSRAGLAAFDFEGATLVVTEAGSKRRAALHAVRGRSGLAAHDPGGLDPLATDPALLTERLAAARHTLKRALTDPRILAGIGNAYSDEILHRARLSPFKRASSLSAAELERLVAASRAVLTEWRDRLIGEAGDRFPDKVTAFRPGMAVHGRHRQPCPDCGAPVQRIVYAANESNYCPRCQTGGRVLADRALSRLLKQDWPRSLEELEERAPDRQRAGRP